VGRAADANGTAVALDELPALPDERRQSIDPPFGRGSDTLRVALLAASVAAGAGVAVGMARLAARHPRVAWRYAGVAALITAAILWDVMQLR
jgi:hypothetical protein